MPTVLRTQGFRLYSWSSEPNKPPHAHVDRGGASVKVWLEPVVLALPRAIASKLLQCFCNVERPAGRGGLLRRA